jgi:RND superfamily putative drug exporter
VPGAAAVQPYTGSAAPVIPGLPSPGPKVVNGLIRIDVTLSTEANSVQAGQTITALREAVKTVPGSNAKVGGLGAINLDVRHTKP